MFSPPSSELNILPEQLPLALGVLILLFVVYSCTAIQKPKVKYPPGPPADPLIGHLRSMPTMDHHLTFSKWGQEYGDVVYVEGFGKKVLVLNSFDAMNDLLHKRSRTYSDRPRFVVLEEVMGWDAVVTHMKYSPRFRKHRRLIHGSFHQEAVKKYYSLMDQETITLLHALATTPESFIGHIRRYTAAMIMKIAYGHKVENDSDLFVSLAERATTATIECGSMGSSIIDLIPPLKHLPAWLPGLSTKRNALRARKEVFKMLNFPFNMVKEQAATGHAPPSFTASLLESYRGVDGTVSKEDQSDIQGAAGVLYGAATDTTTCVLTTFILAMVRYPAVFLKVQEEMDRVVGFDRLPDFRDKENLPYLTCVMKEVFRWNSPVPLGIPHRLMEDDIYRGYHIPADTMVIANIWGLTQLCNQPAEFIPERYLKEAPEHEDLVDPSMFVFGFGRRICIGKHFADETTWLAMARIIAAYTISAPVDEKGKTYIPPPAFTSSFVRHPEHFKCTITLRPERSVDRSFTAVF